MSSSVRSARNYYGVILAVKIMKISKLWVSYFVILPWFLLGLAIFLKLSGVRFESPSPNLPLMRGFFILYSLIMAVVLFARKNWFLDKLKHHRRLKTISEQTSLLSMIGHLSFLMPGLGAFILFVSGANVVETILFAAASSILQLFWARYITVFMDRAA